MDVPGIYSTAPPKAGPHGQTSRNRETQEEKEVNGYKIKASRVYAYCGKHGADRHEIFGGANRQTSIRLKFQVDLCGDHHRELHENCTEWAQAENLRLKQNCERRLLDKLTDTGVPEEKAVKTWMEMIGKGKLVQRYIRRKNIRKIFIVCMENGGLPYDTSLSKQFGVINFAEMVKLRKQDIMISRKIFLSFDTLDGKCVRLYLAMKKLEHIKEEVTVPALMNILGISDRALRTTMQELMKSGHAYMIKGNNRNSISNTYHTHRGYSPSEGYMRLSYNDVKAYVSELYGEKTKGNNELKLFLFMLWKFYSGDIFMSQEKLGQHIGVVRNTVCEIVSRLEEKPFLVIHKSRRNGSFFECCEYVLLR